MLLTETRAERAALVNLMSPGNPLVLRAVCPAAVDDVVLLPTIVRDELALETMPSGPRRFIVTYQAVSRELGPYALDPGRTYDALPAEAPTYGDLLALYPDYAALLSGKPNAGLGPDIVVNGSFTSGLTGWGTFWTSGVAIDTSNGTALLTCDGTGGGYVNLDQGIAAGIPATGPRLLRVTGKVRTTSPATGVYVQLWTNKAPEPPQPFAPGVVLTNVQLRPGPAWTAFAVDLQVQDGTHDVAALFLRSDAMPISAVTEWDDVTARWHE